MNPNNRKQDDTLAQIRQIMENKIRPVMRRHQGDIAIVNFESGVLSVQLSGSCRHCPAAQITVEDTVKAALGGKVRDVSIVNTMDEDLLNLAKSILNKENT